MERSDQSIQATDEPVTPNSDAKRSRYGLAIIAFLLAVLIGLAWVIPRWQTERMANVTVESLERATDTWNSIRNEIDGYTATIVVEGPMPGEYRISVRNGDVESVQFNDSPLTLERTSRVWTVDGMLQMVDLDLEKKTRLADAGNNTFVNRAYFDPTYGYPKRYLRFDYSSKSTVTWTVTEFVTSR
ncbi:MAG: hypothetical protein KDB27_19205 [Planctomycetales bacterium]|nr:hypothetical protein [Planctomycetales bacterium]